MEQKIVFKRCEDYLVYLRKIEGKTKTNEGRKSLTEKTEEEKLHAIYRGNCFTVLKIEHLWEKNENNKFKTIDGIESTIFSEKNLVYEAGKEIEEEEYDENIENVCSRGIHYYLDKTTAKFCFDTPIVKQEDFSGVCIQYYENGLPWIKLTYIDGKKNGEFDGYHKNGQLQQKSTYINDKRNGEYVCYFLNGQLWIKTTYIDDKKNGEYTSYYDDGQLCEKTTYINGKKNGEYISYYTNGELHEKITYIDDEAI